MTLSKQTRARIAKNREYRRARITRGEQHVVYKRVADRYIAGFNEAARQVKLGKLAASDLLLAVPKLSEMWRSVERQQARARVRLLVTFLERFKERYGFPFNGGMIALNRGGKRVYFMTGRDSVGTTEVTIPVPIEGVGIVNVITKL